MRASLVLFGLVTLAWPIAHGQFILYSLNDGSVIVARSIGNDVVFAIYERATLN